MIVKNSSTHELKVKNFRKCSGYFPNKTTFGKGNHTYAFLVLDIRPDKSYKATRFISDYYLVKSMLVTGYNCFPFNGSIRFKK